jgi:hypothetical protein
MKKMNNAAMQGKTSTDFPIKFYDLSLPINLVKVKGDSGKNIEKKKGIPSFLFSALTKSSSLPALLVSNPGFVLLRQTAGDFLRRGLV